MSVTTAVAVHDKHIELITHIKIAADIEIYVAATEQVGTLFFNELEIEFRFNPITARAINQMIDADFSEQILLAQVLKQHELSTVCN